MNALGTFQRAKDVLLTKGKLQFALMYLDYIVIYSGTSDEHLDHVRQLLPVLYDAGVAMNQKSANSLRIVLTILVM